MKKYIIIIMIVLAAIGVADSIYLTLIHYQLIGHTPQIVACSLGPGGCKKVLDSPNASLFGLPNAELGLMYFSILMGAITIRILTGKWVKPWLFLGFMVVGLFYSIFLLYDMLFILGVPCPYCILAHTSNLLIFVLFTLSNPFEGVYNPRLRSA